MRRFQVEVAPDREPIGKSCRAAPQGDIGSWQRARPRPSRRALTLLAIVFGSLAFSAAAHAALDETTTGSDPSTTPPAASAAAPASAAADAAQTAVTTAATNEGESLVSAQYQGQTGENHEVAPPVQKPATASALPVVHRLSESSTASQAIPAATAANPLLNTHVASRTVQRRVSDTRPPAEHRAASGPTTPQPQSQPTWYQPRNSQYQFDSTIPSDALHTVARIPSETRNEQKGDLLSSTAIDSALIHLTVHVRSLKIESASHPVPVASMSAANLLQVALCPSLTPRLVTRNCAAARRRYHAGQPQYRPDPTQRDAVSNVIVRLGEAAAQLAVRGTLAARLPAPQGPDARTTTTPTSPPAGSRPLLPQARAAVMRTLSLLVEPRLPELTAAAPAARIAKRIAKSLAAALLLKLGALPNPSAIVGRAPPAGHLTDTRRLLQIGLAFGIAYFVFLTFWFWRTRGRHRGLRGGARF
jgi:hypothetical protein